MMRRGNLGTWLGLAFLAELLVFVAVARCIGFGNAVALSLVSAVFGAVMLRRSGLGALAALRGFAEGPRPEGVFIDGMLSALGALLLILPGFLSDLCGLFLLAPSGRQWLVRRIGVSAGLERRGHGQGPRTIDLGDGDFTRLDNAPGR